MKAKTAWMAMAAGVAIFGTNDAQALTQRVNGITWEYHVSNGEAAIFTGGRSPAIPRTTAGAITVPSTLGGYPVKRIGNAAFYGCEKLTSVTIPNGVTSIGEDAFCACRKMTRVTIPASVTRIEREAFWNCEALQSVKIPAGAKNIANCVFHNCHSLKNLTLPNGVTNIGAYAFKYCHALTNVSIPPSVKSIGEGAFWECLSLKSLAIPNGVTNIAHGLCCSCSALKSVSIPNSVKSIEMIAFEECGSLASVTIPNSVESIGSEAFAYCASLRSVTIPESVKWIEGKVFWACDSLTNAVILGNIENNYDTDRYGYRPPFYECANLKTVFLGGRMTKIGESMFDGCVGLTSVTIGSNVESIGYRAFHGCNGLETLSVPASWEGTDKLYDLWRTLPYACEVRYLPEQKVAFDSRGGSCGMASRLYVKSQPYGWLPSASREGWAFKGWWTEPNGTGVRVLPTSQVQSSHHTLYAFWEQPPYTVAFNANGGTGKMAKQKMTYGKAAKLRKNAFKRKGYTFIGWAKTKKGAVAYKNGATVKNLRTDGKTTTLYAKWAKKSYTVAFNANGGSGKMAKQQMTYGKKAKLRKNTFKRNGYTFIGWAKTKTGAVVYKNGAVVKNLRTDGKTTTLYAKWKAAQKGAKKGLPGRGAEVTTSDGSDGYAVADGDESTGWTPEGTEGGAWVVLSFAKARDVAAVEVVGENLPEGMRVLLSEDAESWREGVPGAARYVWVAFPEGSEGVDLREVRVVERK